MYILKTEQTFDSAHFLAGYQGKCKNIHGHQWRVVIEICGDSLQQEGQMREMLVDFGQLKEDVKREADALDHALIIEKGSLKDTTLRALLDEDFRIIQVPFRPTAECFARYFYRRMSSYGYRVLRATVYETPVNCASYEA